MRRPSHRVALAVAIALTTAGCASYPSLTQSATRLAPADKSMQPMQVPVGTVQVDMSVLGTLLGQMPGASGLLGQSRSQRHVANAINEFGVVINQARLTVSGPGIPLSAPVTATKAIDVPYAPNPLMPRLMLPVLPPAGTISLQVPAGVNRVFTLEVLDPNGHMLGYIKGAGTVEAGKTNTVRFDMVETAIARTLEYLQTDPAAPDDKIRASLASQDLTGDLRTFIVGFTGYKASDNTWNSPTSDADGHPTYLSTKVNPTYFRSRLLAKELGLEGRDFLHPVFDQGWPAPAYSTLATPAEYTLNFELDGAPLPGDSPGNVVLCGPIDVDSANLSSDTITHGTLQHVPAGQYTLFVGRQAIFNNSTAQRRVATWQDLQVEEILPKLDAPVVTPDPITIPIAAISPAIAFPKVLPVEETFPIDNATNILSQHFIRNPKDHQLYMVNMAPSALNGMMTLELGLLTPGATSFVRSVVASVDIPASGRYDNMAFDKDGTFYFTLSSNSIRVSLHKVVWDEDLGDYKHVQLFEESTTDVPPLDDAEPKAYLSSEANLGYMAGLTASTTTPGVLYFFDFQRGNVRRLIDADGKISVVTLAGAPSGTSDPDPLSFKDGIGDVARFIVPSAMAPMADGSLALVEGAPTHVRRLVPAGAVAKVSTIAGGDYGFADGTGTAAGFSVGNLNYNGITADSAGNLYMMDGYSYAIRKVTPEGVVTTLLEVAPWYSTPTDPPFPHPLYGFSLNEDGDLTYVYGDDPHTLRVLHLNPASSQQH